MNNIDILNDIMKPYFDKKTEIEAMPSKLANEISEVKEKLSELNSDRLDRKKALQLELEELRVRKTVTFKDFEERKEREIEEYITVALNSNSNFYSNYGSMLRKDLERNYDRKLQELEEEFRIKEEKLVAQIKELSSKSEEEREEAKEISNLDGKPDYKNVYLREMVELKDVLRIKLFAERKRLKAKLEELMPSKQEYDKVVADFNQKQLELKELIDNIANFKYEHNDQNQVVNIADINALYDQREIVLSEIEKIADVLSQKTNIINEINDLNKSLEKVEEYIKMTELTNDETRAVMTTMTHWEKEEYDRRKGILPSETVSLTAPTQSETKVQKQVSLRNLSANPDMIEVPDPVVSKYEIEDERVVVDTKIDLLKAIFNDIIAEVKGIRGIAINPSKEKLGADEYYVSTKDGKTEEYEESGTVNLYEANELPMELPNGEYVYYKDINDAVDNYYEKNKGKTYVVKSTGKEYEINLGTITKFRKSLRHCSALKLIKDEKISKLDITRILGKPKTEKLFRAEELGTIYGKPNMPEGDYVNRNQLIAKLNNLFNTKKLDWLRNVSIKLKGNEPIIGEVVDEETDDKKKVK